MARLDQKFIDFVLANPKLVTRRESELYPGLYVIKYTRKVFYDALWNDILEECRGLVVDADWNIIVRPFRKIYNRGENNVDIHRDEVVTAVRKINGFMAAATLTHNHGLIISTTGSLDSDFARMAAKYLGPLGGALVPATTYLFEICDPQDPHIIPEKYGAWLIGVRHPDGDMAKEHTLDVAADFMRIRRPEWSVARFSDVVESVKMVEHEGFVVHGRDVTLKIKSPHYLVNKLFARIGRERLCSSWLLDSKKTIDEEYYPLIDHINENRIAFSEMDEQKRLEFMREFLYG